MTDLMTSTMTLSMTPSITDSKMDENTIEIYTILDTFIDSFGPVIVYLLREFKQHISIWFLNIIFEKIDFSNIMSNSFIAYCKNITDITSKFYFRDNQYRLFIFNLYIGILNDNDLVTYFSMKMKPQFMKIIDTKSTNKN
jgi:hypothetical protein